MSMLVQKPKGDRPFPTVVFVHGLGMSLHEWNNSHDEIAERLNRGGILTVQFQFPIFINGKTVELPLTKRAEIFSGVLAQVNKRDDVDSSRIGILAQSYGVPTLLCAPQKKYDASIRRYRQDKRNSRFSGEGITGLSMFPERCAKSFSRTWSTGF